MISPRKVATFQSQNAQKLRIGGPGAAHVEVLDAEVRALHIVQPNPPLQGQALNRSIRDRAAEPSVLQQLLPREALPALQADQVPLHGFHGQEGALLHLAAGPDQSQPRPDPHGLRRIRRHRAAGLVLQHQGFGGREPAILPIVDLQSLRMGDDEAHVGLAPPREAPPGLPHGNGQRDLLRLVDSQPSQELEDPLVEAPALRELGAAAGCPSAPCRPPRRQSYPAPRAAAYKVPEQQEANLLVHTQAGYVSPQWSV